jgi:hypothetical protein
MNKIAYTLIRYALTAAGASVVTWSEDVVTQLSTAVVTVCSVLFAIWREKKGLGE